MRPSLCWAGWLLTLLIASNLACAQNSPTPGASTPSQSVQNPATTNSPTLQPDTHPLAGAYLFTLCSAFEGHNYIQPQFSIGEMGTTNAQYVSNTPNQLTLVTIPEASLALLHASRRNEISLNYLGGGYIYNNRNTSFDTDFQSLNFSDTVQFRRLTLSFADIFSYLPNSAFGFGGIGGLGGLGSSFGGIGGLGGSLGQINPMFVPNQSILTNSIGTYNNTALLEGEYALTARTSITATGSYGTLQSGNSKSGFLNENEVMGSGGVQHSLTAKDTVGLSYYYAAFYYVGLPQSFKSNSIDFDYGRKITGRLALQLYGGPEMITNRSGQFTSTQTTGSGFGNLTTSAGRNEFGLSGGRYATGGSGILAGSMTEMIGGSWSRQLTRKWSFSLNSGFSRNATLAAQATPAFHYDYWYSEASLNRTLGRTVSFYLNYTYYRQLTNAGTCTSSAVCAANLSQELFGFGFIFSPRPIGL